MISRLLLFCASSFLPTRIHALPTAPGFPDDHGGIDSHSTIARLAEISRNYALAGAHMVAPSDMMDSRIAAIRSAIPEQTALMSYAAKFASAMYGPFRDAAGSGCVSGDRSGYQLPIASRRLALR